MILEDRTIEFHAHTCLCMHMTLEDKTSNFVHTGAHDFGGQGQ